MKIINDNRQIIYINISYMDEFRYNFKRFFSSLLCGFLFDGMMQQQKIESIDTLIANYILIKLVVERIE